MSRISYGYKIENGKVIIDDIEGDIVEKIFDYYLSGHALQKIAELLNIKKSHASIKRILINKRYLGDKNYPKIIDEDIFNRAGRRLEERATALGRVWDTKKENKKLIPKSFIYQEKDTLPTDPFERASIQYQRIEVVKNE